MRKIILLTVVIMLTGCGDGILTSLSTGDLATPDHAYELDTWGKNSEVYEFTPKSNNNITCVYVILDNLKAMGLQCFAKQ
jgi:hypothetical protein